ncbi:hypothetical protein LJR030_000445 [Rhizobium sp. LjRoot30]|uniref:hypothetical protein n=1 Tax=Rhizobium sp. LjRoot30 TaxID=3342320 RepID=UPI003ECF7494
MAGIDEFRSFTNTPSRRHTFYCYCTQKYIQDQAVFFLLVEAYRESRLKRQAEFLNNWFINGGIPAELEANAYLGVVNISDAMTQSVNDSTNSAIRAVGRNFAEKRANHGGGIGGFFGALKQKVGDTKVGGTLFDKPLMQVVGMLGDRSQGFDGGCGYEKDGNYQPNGKFAGQVSRLRKELKAVNFDPDKIGIY